MIRKWLDSVAQVNVRCEALREDSASKSRSYINERATSEFCYPIWARVQRLVHTVAAPMRIGQD
jgi:hypothetical protein